MKISTIYRKKNLLEDININEGWQGVPEVWNGDVVTISIILNSDLKEAILIHAVILPEEKPIGETKTRPYCKNRPWSASGDSQNYVHHRSFLKRNSLITNMY